MTTERVLPFDTRPLPDEDLLEPDRTLLRQIETALLDIARTAYQQERAEDPWANPDERRTPRVLMIDGERGAGKTSLLLTLLKVWRDGASKNPVFRDKWQSTELAPLIRALPPLDFDPMPPGLPLLAWIVQAFFPLVELVQRKSQELGPRTLSDLDRAAKDGSRSFLSQWQRLHDNAAVAWQDPGARQAYESGEDQLRRVRKWSEFEGNWRIFLDDLCHHLADIKAWPGGKGILVLPIDDVDMQITRTPELVRALRLLYHPRLVFLLTGHGSLLDHVLQLDFDGQRARLVSNPHLESHDSSSNLGVRMAEKTVRMVMRFPLERLDLPDALEWLQNKNNDSFGAAADGMIKEVLATPEKWRGLVEITRRQLTDFSALIERSLSSEENKILTQHYGEQKVRAFTLLRLLFQYTHPNVWFNDHELLAAAQQGGIDAVVNHLRNPTTGGVYLELAPTGWSPIGNNPQSTVFLAENPVIIREGAAFQKPLDRWLKLALDLIPNGYQLISWRGLQGGVVLKTASNGAEAGTPWPSPWFAKWAGASGLRLKSAETLASQLRDLILEEKVSERGIEGLLCAWVRFHQPALQTVKAEGDERLKALLATPVIRDNPGEEVVDGSESLLALAHPTFKLPRNLADLLLTHIRPYLAVEDTASEEGWEKKWRSALVDVDNTIGKAVDLLINTKSIREDRLDIFIGKTRENQHARLLASVSWSVLARSTALVRPWDIRMLLELAGPGAWVSVLFGKNGVADSSYPNISFSNLEGKSRYIAIMLLRSTPYGDDRGAMWDAPGFAAEAVGRLAHLQGWYQALSEVTHPIVRSSGGATKFIQAVWVELQKHEIARWPFGPNNVLWMDDVSLLHIRSPKPIAAHLVDLNEPTNFEGILVHRSLRWQFRADWLPTDHALRDAICSWLFLANDVAKEQGTSPSLVELDVQAMPWIEIDGEKLEPPPLEKWSDWDRLRVIMETNIPDLNSTDRSRSAGLWCLTWYLEAICSIHMDPWNWRQRVYVRSDLDSAWTDNRSLLNISSDSVWDQWRSRAPAFAQWWLRIRDPIKKAFGPRIAERLQRVDMAAEETLERVEKLTARETPKKAT